MELLEVMLEETSDKSTELAEEIGGSLDIAALHDTLADFYELMSNPEVKQLGFSEEVERGLFRTYHVLVHLGDYKIPSTITEQIGECGVVRCEGGDVSYEGGRVDSASSLVDKKLLNSQSFACCSDTMLFPLAEPQKEAASETRDAWEFCKNRSRSVEVFYRNMDGDQILTRLHFQFHPEVNTLFVCDCNAMCCVCSTICVCVCARTQHTVCTAKASCTRLLPRTNFERIWWRG